MTWRAGRDDAGRPGRSPWAVVLVGALAVGVVAPGDAAGAGQEAPATVSGDPAPPRDTVGAGEGAEAHPAHAGVVFDGESGGLAGASASANAVVSAAAARRGAGGLALSADHEPSYVRWGTDAVPQGHPHASLRLWVRVLERGAGESVDLVTVGNARQTRNFDFFVNGIDQRFQWDLFWGDTDQSDFVVVYDRWYLVEARIHYGATRHTAEVRIDGVSQGTITSEGTPTTVRMLNVGFPGDKTHRQHYDDIDLRVGDQPLGWIDDTPPEARPDARIRRGTGRRVGDDVYNRSGHRQTRIGRARPGRRVVFVVSVQNDAPFADALAVRAAASTPRFVVRYFDAAGRNITRAVRTGTYRTPTLAPGAHRAIRAVVTVRADAPRDVALTRLVTARSTTTPTIRDTVRFITRRA